MQKIAHNIKKRSKPNDVFYTPRDLAKYCIDITPFDPDDFILDAFAGDGAFYDQYPGQKDWCEIERGRDFFEWNDPVHWIITNPPYSLLDNILIHSSKICTKGFGYLIGIHNLTPRRIEMMNNEGFGLTGIHMCKVWKWFSMTLYVQFEKDKENIITYDRIVWGN